MSISVFVKVLFILILLLAKAEMKYHWIEICVYYGKFHKKYPLLKNWREID
jgi:hypothetical protein